MRARLTAIAAAATLCAPAFAEAGGPRYRFVAKSTLTVTTTSSCAGQDGRGGVMERLTWELQSRQAGTSAIGRGSRSPKGFTRLTGTIRHETARQYEGHEPMEPQGATEPMQALEQRNGIMFRAPRGRLELRLSHLGLVDPTFAPLPVGARRAITQEPAPESSTTEHTTTDGGSCVDEERSELTRRIVIVRVR